jgi:hypothetical protein
MVRRQGKRKTQAVLGLGNGEKKEGESSSAGLDKLGTCEPKCRREDKQRVRAPRPGSPSLYSSFKLNCVELDS